MEIHKNPLIYGIISGMTTYVYMNYISKYYNINNQYNLLYPVIVFIGTTILSMLIINNYMNKVQVGGDSDIISPLVDNFNKLTNRNITMPKSINDLPDIFVKI